MTQSIEVKFDREITKAEWEQFYLVEGGSFCLKISGFNTFAFSSGVEIVLDEEGVSHDGVTMPPRVFRGLVIKAMDRDTSHALHLCRRIKTKLGGTVVKNDPVFDEELAPKGFTVWGDKPLSADSFEKVDTRRIFDRIKQSVVSSTYDLVNDDSLKTEDELFNRVLDSVYDTMAPFRGEGFLTSYNITDPEVIVVTWNELYPMFWQRWLIQFLRHAFKIQTVKSGAPGLFRRMVGYHLEQHINIDRDQVDKMVDQPVETDEVQSLLEQCIEVGALSVEDRSVLPVPYRYVSMDVSITPVASVRHIKFNVSVGNENF